MKSRVLAARFSLRRGTVEGQSLSPETCAARTGPHAHREAPLHATGAHHETMRRRGIWMTFELDMHFSLKDDLTPTQEGGRMWRSRRG
jgi:hypothetical protein